MVITCNLVSRFDGTPWFVYTTVFGEVPWLIPVPAGFSPRQVKVSQVEVRYVCLLPMGYP